ncbi:TetR/AcrR family transcriptional regulator [Mycobacterium antarcticum]|uniref:TetR/AcrR family transcriptional regulator n=1 Tax=Mycolicibacterium sp. TUM20984 TaxID=3023368 RepID=UPI0024E0E7CE|nr:TetR/AcrR family transcriptional regulator [Mycolicibacterium sp. TUM20984]
MPSPARGLSQPQRVEASAHRLVRATAQLITEKGWEATTAAEIGRRAGYSRAMVHARYGGKDAILDVLFRSTYDARFDGDVDGDGLHRAVAHFDRSIALYAEDREFLRAMFMLTFEAVKSASPVRSRLQEWLSSSVETVTTGIRAGIADGSVRADVDVESATIDISTAGLGVAHQWMVFGDDHPFDDDLRAVRDRIIRDYGSSGTRGVDE